MKALYDEKTSINTANSSQATFSTNWHHETGLYLFIHFGFVFFHSISLLLNFDIAKFDFTHLQPTIFEFSHSF